MVVQVVQNGRKCSLEICKTESKGWGVFNGEEKLLQGTFLGIYAGELLTDAEGDLRGQYVLTNV